MAWVRLDANFTDHPKVLEAGPLAGWLYICGLTYAARHQTDGVVPRAAVARMTFGDEPGIDVDPQALAFQLITAGLWEIDGDDYRIHDYLACNPSRAEQGTTRQQGAARQRAWRERQRTEAVTPLRYRYGDCVTALRSARNAVTDQGVTPLRSIAAIASGSVGCVVPVDSAPTRRKSTFVRNAVTDKNVTALRGNRKNRRSSNNYPGNPGNPGNPGENTSSSYQPDMVPTTTTTDFAPTAEPAIMEPSPDPKSRPFTLAALSADARHIVQEWRAAHGKRSPPRLNPAIVAKLEAAIPDLGVDRLLESVRWSAEHEVPEFYKVINAARTKRQREEDDHHGTPERPPAAPRRYGDPDRRGEPPLAPRAPRIPSIPV